MRNNAATMVSGSAPTLPPREEAERLAALADYAILDTPPEAGFDDLTAIAAAVCHVPIALVSLVDDHRQWFKSAHGLAARETPRSQAFCAHALVDQMLLEVPDATQDPRFAQNPLVTGDPKIRFYAGAPLITDSGHALGTLCVIDTVPRALDKGQQDALQALARQVVAQLELRRLALAQREEGRHQQLLNAELQHRIKNLLTVVQSIVLHTLRGAATSEDALGAIQARLMTLAAANDLLSHSPGTAAPIDAIVEATRHVLAHERGQIEAHGPSLALPPRAALALALMLHELGTNAVKYGALSVETGRVSLNWRIEDSGVGEVLVIDWLETGGPPVETPARTGFGTRLIARLDRDMGGVGKIRYDAAGLGWTLRAPLAELLEG
ncbi:HWE histidine kinase domain-containing protein [Sphingomonas sp. 1P06PA]|uniref:sensor histidine kinase n=1 Tax=Sphingomonas sp. 1P06PA TaxID=554121 RepID=UPI0039A53623